MNEISKINSASSDPVIGIDFGTTNSEISVVTDNGIEILEIDGETIMPSYVGFDPSGTLLIGREARNQYVLYPDRTVRSIKRRIDDEEKIDLGAGTYQAREIAAMIMRRLKQQAEQRLGRSVSKAVITLPAQFSDSQRQATRDAGRIAGLEVLRILHEPTAATLAYQNDQPEKARSILTFDLGGGTFDVSIVRMEKDIIEVVASHGDSRLGGDDMDALIADWIRRQISNKDQPPAFDPTSEFRITQLAETVKIHLTDHPYAKVIASNLTTVSGESLAIDAELQRDAFEALIQPLTDRMLSAVHQTLADGGLRTGDVDEIILVGGATRIPLIQTLLEAEFGRRPRRDVHPDLAVAYGAGIMAARLMGKTKHKVLIDITPFTFGIACLDLLNGVISPHKFAPIIKSGTPLPVSQAELFNTMRDNQLQVNIDIFQGESEDVRENILVGRFAVEGLAAVPAGNEIVAHMTLDLDGILRVTASEKCSGLSKDVTIEDALAKLNPEAIAQSQDTVARLFGQDETASQSDFSGDHLPAGGVEYSMDDSSDNCPDDDNADFEKRKTARALIKRVAESISDMDEMDKSDADQLVAGMKTALETKDISTIEKLSLELEDLLFYLEVK